MQASHIPSLMGGQAKRVGVYHKAWLNSSRMHNTISTAASWARGHSLEFWNTQQWQVWATRPRRGRRIPARAPPGAHTCCRSRIQRQSSKGFSSVCQRMERLRAHKETRLQQPSQVSNQSSDGLLIHTSGQLHARPPA